MLDVETLMGKAEAQTGLSDWGSDDFREPLDRLVAALDSEARLNAFGEMRSRMQIASGLEDRLRIVDYVDRHSDLRDGAVERPIFIVGLPRTGTTALHHLLNHDPRNRTLRIWEARSPVPPPEEATYRTDPRIAATEAGIERTEQFMPGFFTTHLLGTEEPDECYMLFNRNFMSVEFSALYHIPSFANWLYAQDLRPTYAYHKLQLQLLQYRKPGHWALKAPFHQLGLEAILDVYPDALIVQTHRAPMTIVASGCSFSETIRRPASDTLDPGEVGRDWMDMLAIYTRTFEAARARLEPAHPGQFIDLQHDALVADPLGCVEQVYALADREIDAAARSEMQEWVDAHPKGKHGTHEYDLEKYGVAREEVVAMFSDYAERYGLELE